MKDDIEKRRIAFEEMKRNNNIENKNNFKMLKQCLGELLDIIREKIVWRIARKKDFSRKN